ncbi:MAG: DUF1697 domain-containing protein [Acidimicrobiales bacterium]|nr:DUF1697 domain-containing protein [Acidimicrobiales bacterium]
MSRHVALFRGINVGGHNRVPMAELRQVFETLGFENVTSIIQSGNVCFDSDLDAAAITVAIRRAVAASFDVDVPVLLRTRAEIEAALAAHPYPPGEIEPKLHHVLFLADEAPADAAELIGDHTPSSEYEVIGAEIHVRYPEGSARATLSVAEVDRALDTVATARNLPTVEKIAAALAG